MAGTRLTTIRWADSDPRPTGSGWASSATDHACSYDEYEACLEHVDAVHIALPNSMHAEYTVRAAEAGVHVLCEKPMAVTVEECEQMIAACHEHRVRLMVAYRLHFEEISSW